MISGSFFCAAFCNSQCKNYKKWRGKSDIYLQSIFRMKALFGKPVTATSHLLLTVICTVLLHVLWMQGCIIHTLYCKWPAVTVLPQFPLASGGFVSLLFLWGLTTNTHSEHLLSPMSMERSHWCVQRERQCNSLHVLIILLKATRQVGEKRGESMEKMWTHWWDCRR